MKKRCFVSDDIRLDESGGNIAAVLFRMKREYRWHYDRIVRTIQLILPELEDFALEPMGENNMFVLLRWRQKGWDAVLPPDLLSDGSLRFICLATLLGLDKFPPLILIDEPELGLHPAAIELLAEMLKVAARFTQVIVTTQSPALIDHFTPEDVIVVDQQDGASNFRRLKTKDLEDWLENFRLGDLWRSNVLGDHP